MSLTKLHGKKDDKCNKCSHVWFSRGEDRPNTCPHCKTARWDKEPKKPKTLNVEVKIKTFKSKNRVIKV